MNKTLSLAIAGLGTVGVGVLELLAAHRDFVKCAVWAFHRGFGGVCAGSVTGSRRFCGWL